MWVIMTVGALMIFAAESKGEVTCPSSLWVPLNETGSCYLTLRHSLSFYDADNYCRSLGAQVASITSPTEMLFVNSIFGNSRYWIGLRRIFDVWMWLDGSPVTYLNWRTGSSEPDKCCGTDVSCVVVNYIGSTGMWDDTGCTCTWDGFICKRAGVSTAKTTATATAVTTVETTTLQPCVNGNCPSGYACNTTLQVCEPEKVGCIHGLCPAGFACKDNLCISAPNDYGDCDAQGNCSEGFCYMDKCVG